jgi:transcriptional regulator with XRE-family HTH domain
MGSVPFSAHQSVVVFTRSLNVPTFARFIARRRKELQLTQKEVASQIKQDDGKPLSVQYLNDIEHGRRAAPPDYVIKQFAIVLRLEPDLLYFRAGRLPMDIRIRAVSDDRAVAAFLAFRTALRRRRRKSKK